MWAKIKLWCLDHEKICLPIILIAIILIWWLPEFFYKGAVTLFLLFKAWEIATDKSTNSLVKDIKNAKPNS